MNPTGFENSFMPTDQTSIMAKEFEKDKLEPTLLAEWPRSFLDRTGKRKQLRRFLPLPKLSRKIEGDSVRRVTGTMPIQEQN